MQPTDFYAPLRLALALFCVPVAWFYRRWYFTASSVALLFLPPSTADDWRHRWLLFEIIRLLLAVALSASLIIKQDRILDSERRFIVGFGVCAGLALTLAGWLWVPRDWFDAVVTARQYLYLLLTVTTICWRFRLWARPAYQPAILGPWCWWLVFTTISATAGRGGLLWAVTPWRGGAETWALVGDVDVAGKILVCLLLLINFYVQ